jgi:uncharacterized Ntn-hydrolase superfamily protein
MTYSILARDPSTGELGVAVQSHWFSVGSVVAWARPGVGAVATQALARAAYGPEGLALMQAGTSAPEALSQLLAGDPGAALRQVAMIDAHGRHATHTGERCIGFAGHSPGEQVSCQANMMRSETVWGAMLEAFLGASGPLAGRLMVALEAAEAEGGDARGRQSAAILTVPERGEPWETTVSLRVEDHPEPLVELRRLLRVHEAYALADEAERLAAEGRHQEAAERWERALMLAPDSHELRFWSGLGAAVAGELPRAVAEVRAAIAAEPGWRGLLARMPGELAPAAPEVLRELERRERAAG